MRGTRVIARTIMSSLEEGARIDEILASLYTFGEQPPRSVAAITRRHWIRWILCSMVAQLSKKQSGKVRFVW